MGKTGIPGLRRRAPVVNGIFYPDKREVLTAQLASWGLRDGSATDSYASQFPAENSINNRIQAILAPHGAWDLTGNIAGKAFRAVQQREEKNSRHIRRVLLFSTYHNYAEENIYLSESAFFDTPLGELPVDQELNQELACCSPHIRVYDIPHLSEHALEVLLPMVRYCFPCAKIVPVLMAGAGSVLISSLANALKTVLGNCAGESLIVVSSNVSQNPDPAIALAMAEDFLGLIAKMDARTFLAAHAGGRISACGGALIGALLESNLLHGKQFSPLCPIVQAAGENGNTVYYGALDCAP